MRTVRNDALLMCAVHRASAMRRGSVFTGNDLGDYDQRLYGTAGTKGGGPVRGGGASADFLLYPCLWVDAALDLETGKQSKEVSVAGSGWFFLSGIGDHNGGLSESVDFTANFKKNVRKKC